MKIICSWCNAIMQAGTLPVSHGICPECQATQNALLDELEAEAKRRRR